MASDTLSEERSLLRLMHLLRGGGPATPSRASVRGTVLLTCGARGTVAVDKASLRKAVRAGLLEMNADGLVALSEQGQRVARGRGRGAFPRAAASDPQNRGRSFRAGEANLQPSRVAPDADSGAQGSQRCGPSSRRRRSMPARGCARIMRRRASFRGWASTGNNPSPRAGRRRPLAGARHERGGAGRPAAGGKGHCGGRARPCRHSGRRLLFPEGSGTCRGRARLAGPLGQDRAQDGPAGPRPALPTFCRGAAGCFIGGVRTIARNRGGPSPEPGSQEAGSASARSAS
jgi:hypothetical protein